MWCVAAALLLPPVARADWIPGDYHKMHFPQLPDSDGWDVSMMGRQESGGGDNNTQILADNWKCTETGLVDDVTVTPATDRDGTVVRMTWESAVR